MLRIVQRIPILNTMKTFQNKVVWLTGASSGIGEALAYALSSRKAKLILSSRNQSGLERVKRCCENGGDNILVLPLDLTCPQELEQKANEAWNHFGKIDYLFLNAGIAVRDLAVSTLPEMDRLVMETNYFGPMLLTKYILPHLLEKQNGHIVVVSSLSGKYGIPRLSAYAASKHALHGYFESLRAEVAGRNLKISMIVPGFISTPLALHTRDGKGNAYGKAIEVNESGMSPEVCAEKILRAVAKEKQEALVGGAEISSVYLNRFFPVIFSRIIRNHPMRRFRHGK